MNKKIIIGLSVVFLGVVAGAFLIGGGPTDTADTQNGSVAGNGNKVKAVVSFYPLYFFAQQIGGEKAEVKNITPAGAEPHEYELTSKDSVNIENSSLLILNGGGLEPWAADVEKNLGENSGITIVFAADGLINQHMMEDGESIPDPHVWLDPSMAKLMADRITEGFAWVDKSNADYYRANNETLKAKLGALDLRFKTELGNCTQNNIVTSHTAFSYLAAAYNLKQVPITGLSPEDEPSAKEMAEIADFAKANNIKYIFFESLVSPKLAETIAREIGAQTLVLNPLEGLTKEEISAGKNYFTEMEANLANLKIALECKN